MWFQPITFRHTQPLDTGAAVCSDGIIPLKYTPQLHIPYRYQAMELSKKML